MEIVGVALGYLTIQVGRLAIWMVSLGRWRGEQLLGDEGRIHGAAGALSFVRDGRRVITETGLLFAGIACLIALVLVSLAVASLF
jgi:hypothetical protein